MENQSNQSVHVVLAQSYLVYFILCAVGLFLEMFFPMRFYVPHATLLAVICFAVGPLLMLWAQYTSHRFEKIKQEIGAPVFHRGPYRYLRNPTQLGLLILVLGYALISGAAMLFVATGVAYLLSNIFFRKHESILETKYGAPYQAYKSSVRKIM